VSLSDANANQRVVCVNKTKSRWIRLKIDFLLFWKTLKFVGICLSKYFKDMEITYASKRSFLIYLQEWHGYIYLVTD